MYEYIDKNMPSVKRYTQKVLNNLRLELLKSDELNVNKTIKEVKKAYRKIEKKSRQFYVGLLDFLEEEHGFNTGDYDIYELMDMIDPVLLYAFSSEFERKRSRYSEVLLGTSDISNPEVIRQQERATKLLNRQIEEFGVGIEWQVAISEMKKDKVEKVRWITQEDERVCSDCADLNGHVFSIDNVPNRPHIGCRCILERV